MLTPTRAPFYLRARPRWPVWPTQDPRRPLIPPDLRFVNLSPLVLISDPSKSGAKKAVAVAAAINKPEIEVKEAGGGGGINFMVYAVAVFCGLLLVGGALYSSWTP